RRMVRLHDDAAIAVEDAAGEVLRFLDHDRTRGAHQRLRHVLDDELQGIADHLTLHLGLYLGFRGLGHDGHIGFPPAQVRKSYNLWYDVRCNLQNAHHRIRFPTKSRNPSSSASQPGGMSADEPSPSPTPGPSNVNPGGRLPQAQTAESNQA